MQAMLPSSEWTKSQVDRLGDRLRKGDISEDDLGLLDSYRRSFSEGYEDVVSRIRGELGLEPTGRPAKSTTAIIDKLQRESVRLSQMQDIAGCRVVVLDLLSQDEALERLTALFDRTAIVDRREQPSYGYRGVHVIVENSGKLIEVQVRTFLQHRWAQLSEKLSDVIDSTIKYGGGDQDVAMILRAMSEKIKAHEIAEARHSEVMSSEEEDEEMYHEGMRLPNLMSERLSIIQMLDAIGEVIPRMKGRNDALSD